MRRLPALTLLWLALAPGVARADSSRSAPARPCEGAASEVDVVAFAGVDVVPMDGERILREQTVVVRDGRIADLGPAALIPVPAGAVRIEGRGRTLMPGLAEMHAHVPGEKDPALREILALYVLTGATTVRAMLGTPYQLELRRQIEGGELLGPTLFAVAPPFNPGSVTGPEDARERVREYHAAGYDQLKMFGVPSRVSYDAIAETARAVGIRFAGHVPENIGLRHAIAMGQSIEHLDGYLQASGGDAEAMDELAQQSASAGIWNTPTLDVWKTLIGLRAPAALDDRPELAYVPSALVREWRERTAVLSRGSALRRALETLGVARSASEVVAVRDRMLEALHRAGARLLLGADSPQLYSVPGFSLAHELQAMHAAGVPRYAVLEAATRNPAEYFGQAEVFGQVAAGMRADLLLVEGDPLADLRNVHRQAGVMLRGCWLPRAEIDRQLGSIAARFSRTPQAPPDADGAGARGVAQWPGL